MVAWGEFWSLMVWVMAIPMAMMLVVWEVSRRLNNAGIVDIFWSYGFIPVAAVCAVLGAGNEWRSTLLLFMITVWSGRLGTYLLIRVASHHPEEDGRYAMLRKQFPQSTWVVFFVFFQMQAVLIALLCVPFVLVFINADGGIGWPELAGAVLWLLAMTGEAMADAQLHQWRSHPENAGKTCRTGLWRYSRHPNYFCEWLVWVAYFVFALGSPGGWIAVYAPLLMYIFLTRVTGIKTTEAHALRSRGEDYGRYQRSTNAFFPWFPRP